MFAQPEPAPTPTKPDKKPAPTTTPGPDPVETPGPGKETCPPDRVCPFLPIPKPAPGKSAEGTAAAEVTWPELPRAELCCSAHAE
ncbi:MAG: hypothetical protein K1X79_04070 [Oligoflexia bacterium]|nr:hypothetical protein [Oligoflexia bacterium]